jgi:AraC family transcriptional regulator
MAKTPTSKTSTLADYGKRIERVVRYIFAHLDEDLDVARLAETACFSPYHFHRIYHAMMGETVNDTVRRLRLHRAAFDLIHDQKSITTIAVHAGYGSVEAFSRAFKASYGLPPAAYRDKGRLVVGAPSFPGPVELGPEVNKEKCMNANSNTMPLKVVGIATFEPVTLAAMRHTGPYQEIGQTFQRLAAWAGSRGLFGPGTRYLAVYHDAPESAAPSALRSDACIGVPAGFKPDREDVTMTTIAGGRCAIFHHQGPYAELGAAYRWIYSQWLPQSGEEPGDRPVFEEYLNNPAATPAQDLLTAIYLPLA